MKNINAKAILAFDCSTPHASVALAVAGAVHTQDIAQGRHAAELVPAIDGVLRAHSIAYADLECVATTTGPGSFTGLRIALAVAHGLHLACGVPLKCTTSLAAIAHHAALPALRAIMAVGKGEVAYQDFVGNTASSDIIRASEQDEALFHSNAPLIGTFEHPKVQYMRGIEAAWLCNMAEALPIADAADAVPLYIRPPDAIIPEAPRWLAS